MKHYGSQYRLLHSATVWFNELMFSFFFFKTLFAKDKTTLSSVRLGSSGREFRKNCGVATKKALLLHVLLFLFNFGNKGLCKRPCPSSHLKVFF